MIAVVVVFLHVMFALSADITNTERTEEGAHAGKLILTIRTTV